ncbi:hypothetical protein CON65_14785 [Bacillus pseudomycoides]|uniref:Amino acid transporter n=1 Tax=Bacillus pseudomycoides TaxID=64104 RepID=A0AA91VBJ6_9BACI|nr:hypothetical protein COO03_21155 [Bacillus sp. AFS098217]PED81889.1 hypothetical protein CON65_14785 [Bacillus pseudomycoides]PEU07999.1 hypothetical protein CN524_19510 [Bacillus sp. AFS019443]PEU14259.1 hypothetical protein CN525_18570 [Bacillus sp. AFS014408]PFW59108.1 hypothetical protein COL20_24780 [Bacillus sp. AFS075034]
MPDMIRLILFTFVAISAIFTLIKECKRPQKNVFLISIEFFLLVGMIVLITEILI